MPQFDHAFVRSQFPAFSEPTLENFAHFENAGGSYASGQTIEHLQRFYRETKVQPYYDFAPSHRGGELMDEARRRMAAWLNVGHEEVHLGPSTSQNTYVVAQALRQHLSPGDEVIVTNQDHEANIGAWRRLEDSGITVREWCFNPETAELEIEALESLLNEKTRVVAFTHCSNIVGSVNPVRDITDRIHAAGAIAIVDGVSYCPHGLPDPVALGADIYLFSLYKVYGPHLGVMYMRADLNQRLPNQGHFFNAEHATARFTPAGPDHAQVAATNGVLDYLELVHDHHFGEEDAPEWIKANRVHDLFRQRESALLPPLLDFLSGHPRIRLIGKDSFEGRAPTVAFSVDGFSPAELGTRLGAQGIGVGVGNFYAYRAIRDLGIEPDRGVVRTSFVHYTSEGEIDRLIAALDSEFA